MMCFLHIIGLETGQASDLSNQQRHDGLVTLLGPVDCVLSMDQLLSIEQCTVLDIPDSSTWKDVVRAATTDLQSSVSLLGLLEKAVRISVVKGDNVSR